MLYALSLNVLLKFNIQRYSIYNAIKQRNAENPLEMEAENVWTFLKNYFNDVIFKSIH